MSDLQKMAAEARELLAQIERDLRESQRILANIKVLPMLSKAK